MRPMLMFAAAVVATAMLVFGPGAATAQEAGDPAAGWRGGPPRGAGVHAALWDGGMIEQAAATPGTRSLWFLRRGEFIRYVVGAPAFVNARFRAQFPGGFIPPGTLLLVVMGTTEDDGPAAVVEAFLRELGSSAPPIASDSALVRALSRLTEETRLRLATSGQLASFLGVQDLPDVDATVTLRLETEHEARVHALLRYSGGDVEREFLLLRENDRWHIQAVEAPEAEPPSGATRTQVIHFVPELPDASTAVPGACFTTSLAAMGRADAWRCSVDSDLYDPCFSLDPETVVCGANPVEVGGADGFVLELTEPLPAPEIPPSALDAAEVNGWLVQLQDGTICNFATGATGGVDGARAQYACADRRWILGDLIPGDPWTADVATISVDADGWHAETRETVPVAIVWQ